MKTLQRTLESILDADFDITDQDIDLLDEFLSKYKDGHTIKPDAPTLDLCKCLKYAGEQLERPTIRDVEKIIRAGDAFVLLKRAGSHQEIRMYWPREHDKYNMYYNGYGYQLIWRKMRTLRSISGMPGTLPKNQQAFYFRLPPNEYQKIIDVLQLQKIQP